MTTIKQPTPEEINEAALNEGLRYGVGRYAIVEITFKRAISWLQNYQTQQHAPWNYGHGKEPYLPTGDTQQGVVKSAEDICHTCGFEFESATHRQECFDCDKSENNKPNQFQTPASGGSEWISCKDRYPENRSNVTVYTKNGNSQLIVEYKHGCFFDGLTQIHNVTHWKYLDPDPGQSSQPQQNAISVIEEEIEKVKTNKERFDKSNNDLLSAMYQVQLSFAERLLWL